MLNKNDPLIGAVQEVMKRNQLERDAAKLVNEKFGVSDRKALPHEKQGAWDAAYKQILSEGLHPNQQKLDVHEPEKDKLTKHDFKMLRAKKKPMEEDVTSPSSMGIKKPDYATGTPDYAKSKEQTVNRAAKTSLPAGTMKEEEQIDEKAPPGAKYERMVKHIKDKMSKGGLTKKEKSIAYATAWKAKKKSDVNEGFNNRHGLSVTASAEKQAVADLNEDEQVDGAYDPAKETQKKFAKLSGATSGQKVKNFISTRNKMKSLPKPKWNVSPEKGNYTFNKLKDKAETAVRAATGGIGDTLGITDPKRGEGLRTFNPGAAQAGDLAGAASMLLPSTSAAKATQAGIKAKQVATATTAAKVATKADDATKTTSSVANRFRANYNNKRYNVSGAQEIKPTAPKTQSGLPAVQKTGGQINRLAGKKPGETGPWGSARPPSVGSARQTTPNAAAGNAARLRMAASKAVNTSMNVGRLVGGPSGPSSSFAPSSAAAATAPNTPKVLPQTLQRGAEQDKVGVKRIPTSAPASMPAAPAAQAPAKAKPVVPAATKPAAPAVAQAVRKPQDSSTPAQRAQFNRQIDRGNATPGTQYKGLGVKTGTTIQQKAAPQVKKPVGMGRVK